MAKGEYKGKRVLVTLDQDVYDLLVLSAKKNGIPVATRARQIIAVGVSNEVDGQQDQEVVTMPKQTQTQTQTSTPVIDTQPKQEEQEVPVQTSGKGNDQKPQENRIIIGQAWKK